MLKAYKYRIFPSEEQKVLLVNVFGQVRFVYNLALETKKEVYESNEINLSYFDLNNQIADFGGKNVIVIGRFEPSSKTCNCCGYIKADLKLEEREWVCPSCKELHDRDVNAAINIKNFELRDKPDASQRGAIARA